MYIMFNKKYYTHCPNSECDWNGIPFMSYSGLSVLCVCPNCGYMWSISNNERNYGGGYRK